MTLIEAVQSRKSIRGFLNMQVPRETIREILETATRAPSALNTQPWKIIVVTGPILDRIREANVEQFLSGAPGAFTHNFEGVYRQRQTEVGKEVFRLMGIAREDREKRQAWTARGFRYFDAPVAILIGAERSVLEGSHAQFDLGALSYAISLAATDRGLGTCIEEQGAAYPQAIRAHLELPEDLELVVSIALGYPDPVFPANALESTRAPLDEVITWY